MEGRIQQINSSALIRSDMLRESEAADMMRGSRR